MAGFFGLGPTELIIILVVIVVLFGGSRLAGLGKSSGRAIREFKEETKDLMGAKDATTDEDSTKAKDGSTAEIVDAELVEPQQQTQQTGDTAQQPRQNA